MIAEALEFPDRVAAVDFAMKIVRPDVSEARRIEVALTYGAGKFFALDRIDVDPGARFSVRAGRPRTPIFAFKSEGEIVGAAICSCAAVGYPVRLMMLVTRDDWRRKGVGFELIEHVIGSAQTVGVAPAHEGLKGFFTWSGFRHWRKSAKGGWIGFTRPIALPAGLVFAVPVSADYELDDAYRRL